MELALRDTFDERAYCLLIPLCQHAEQCFLRVRDLSLDSVAIGASVST
jgi:hypothetical protein